MKWFVRPNVAGTNTIELWYLSSEVKGEVKTNYNDEHMYGFLFLLHYSNWLLKTILPTILNNYSIGKQPVQHYFLKIVERNHFNISKNFLSHTINFHQYIKIDSNMYGTKECVKPIVNIDFSFK